MDKLHWGGRKGEGIKNNIYPNWVFTFPLELVWKSQLRHAWLFLLNDYDNLIVTFPSQGCSASELHTPFAQGKLQLHTTFRKKKKRRAVWKQSWPVVIVQAKFIHCLDLALSQPQEKHSTNFFKISPRQRWLLYKYLTTIDFSYCRASFSLQVLSSD